MARQLRLEYDGALYHVTARGNGRQAIYLDDTDRGRFLVLLGEEGRQQHWRWSSSRAPVRGEGA